MEKTPPNFPASAALHGGLFCDRTLREFGERHISDPDKGTRFEGTVNRLPRPGDGILRPQKTIPTTSELAATEESAAVALSGQTEEERAAKRWWAALPAKRKREVMTLYRLVA